MHPPSLQQPRKSKKRKHLVSVPDGWARHNIRVRLGVVPLVERNSGVISLVRTGELDSWARISSA